MAAPTMLRSVFRLRGGAPSIVEDSIAVEQPFPLVGPQGETVTTTMRTPGHDDDLRAGFFATYQQPSAAIFDDDSRVSPSTLEALPDRLRAGQELFSLTGGTHAAGLFTVDGTLVCLREDVGRHNAVDKVVGDAVRRGALPLAGHVLMLSGRTSSEVVSKAAAAGVPILAAVSAPSSTAVALAEAAGMTLIGFLRGPTMNIYTGEHRIIGS
jgi:formate dehydrogenase assembly factor FdhD